MAEAPKTTPVLVIPVVIGRNRLRGKSEGAMVDDDGLTGGSLEQLRKALTEEARLAGFEPTTAWVTEGVSSLLRTYEGQLDAYRKAPPRETIGFVFDGRLPGGGHVVMGEARVLALMGHYIGRLRDGLEDAA